MRYLKLRSQNDSVMEAVTSLSSLEYVKGPLKILFSNSTLENVKNTFHEVLEMET